MNLSDLAQDARIAAASLRDAAVGTVNPTVRLGVAGLSIAATADPQLLARDAVRNADVA